MTPLNASFASALNAARDATAGQHYPQGVLYVVATPIGNLADIGLRALHLLQLADTVACEDTRNTQGLLRGYGIDKSGGQWLAVHQHNEAQAAHAVLQRLQEGQRVVYVSDAGTPGVSDPGARLVAAVHAAGLAVSPVPGASSVVTALSAAGIVDESGFVFAGFPPTKKQERSSVVAAWAREPRTVVLLEAPHRIVELAQALGALGERPITVARELTKRHEQIVTVPAHGLVAWLQADPAQRCRGEFVLLLHALPNQGTDEQDEAEHNRVLQLLLAELPLKTAVQLTAQITGAPRNTLYNKALALKAHSG